MALAEGASALRGAGVAEPRLDAGSLLTYVLSRDRTFLIAHGDDELPREDLERFRRLVERRAGGEPLQYVTGRQEFYGLDFEVTPDVLIPRPETELLVETALDLLRDAHAPSICDVGTGSGCIPVALLHERRDATALALDVSPAALRVAERNAARHGVAPRIRFLVSDCFEALEDDDEARGSRFDLIVSNPPYVAEQDLPGLQREVRDHEPRVALTPGGDGLSVIRRLVRDAPRFLVPDGHFVFEIGFNQHEAVAALVDPSVWTLLAVRQDLQSIPRIVALKLAS